MGNKKDQMFTVSLVLGLPRAHRPTWGKCCVNGALWIVGPRKVFYFPHGAVKVPVPVQSAMGRTLHLYLLSGCADVLPTFQICVIG